MKDILGVAELLFMFGVLLCVVAIIVTAVFGIWVGFNECMFAFKIEVTIMFSFIALAALLWVVNLILD